MPHRAMKLLLDPAHLEMPAHVVGAIVGTVTALAVSAWQWCGSLLAQLPTPDKVTGWQERDIYLCAAIFAVAGIIVLLRWIAAKMLTAQKDNTAAMHEMAASSAAVAEALKGLKDSINGIALHAVEKAVQNAMPSPGPSLGASRKRGTCISDE